MGPEPRSRHSDNQTVRLSRLTVCPTGLIVSLSDCLTVCFSVRDPNARSLYYYYFTMFEIINTTTCTNHRRKHGNESKQGLCRTWGVVSVEA